MAIDTPNKRRSMIASGIQGLTVYSIPDGLTSGQNRRHDTALYAGLGGEPPAIGLVNLLDGLFYRKRLLS